MIHTTTRPTVPTALLLGLLLALTAFFALAALASAENNAPYRPNFTPAAFGKACLDSNGILTEFTGADGVIKESFCVHDGKKSSECDWIAKTCTDFLETTTGGVARPPVDGVLLDDSPGTTQPGFGGVAAPPRGGGAVLDAGP